MSDKLKDYVSLFHEHDIYLPSRSINLSGDVDINLYDKTIKNLHALDSEEGTINIFINSEGGDTDHCMAIYDLIKGCKNLVRGMVYGQASSSASILLQACDERLMSPNSYLMLHYGEESTSGHPLNKKNWDEKYAKDMNWIIDVYHQKIKIVKKRFTKDQLRDMITFDKIMQPKEAIAFGLADRVETNF